ncbi:MAG TPA: hypothetical protein VLQ68_01760 [Rhizobiaceae bacterium]|nr:hypothetical protein [Rhizobiaceae bacterium]
MTRIRLILRRFNLATRIACAVALVLVALAHRPAVSVAADLSAYALPDGSIPALCLPGEDGGNDIAGDAGCEFCRISSAVLLPAPPAFAWPAKVFGERIASNTDATPARRSEFGTRSLRGPPSIS